MVAAATVPFVSVEEYLHHFPSPDVDYVNGVLEERHLGGFEHSFLQTTLANLFYNRMTEWQVLAAVELRVQVAPTRYRVPDVCVLPSSWKRTRIVHEAPLLCLEVKSPEFTLQRERTRAQDYLRMGVREVWIFDPETRKAYVLRGESMTEHREDTLRLDGTAIELDIAALFAVLDE